MLDKKAKDPAGGVGSAAEKRTDFGDGRQRSLKMTELWDSYSGRNLFYYFFSFPELKVCIYFPLKRLVSNSGEGGGGGGGWDFAVQIHCSEVFLSEGKGWGQRMI